MTYTQIIKRRVATNGETELYDLKEVVTLELKKGNIDESSFQLLENRIEKYLDEIKEKIRGS